MYRRGWGTARVVFSAANDGARQAEMKESGARGSKEKAGNVNERRRRVFARKLLRGSVLFDKLEK